MTRASCPSLVVLLLLGACASASPDATTANDPAASNGPALLEVIARATPDGAMPLATLADMAFPDETAHNAIEQAIASCMARKGFSYQPVPFFPVDLFTTDRRYGITDEAIAAEYGYQWPPSPWDALEDEVMARPLVDEIALFGDGATAPIDEWKGWRSTVRVGGCLQEGSDAVVGDYVAWVTLSQRIQSIIAEASIAAESDPRVQAAVAEWAACMAEAGYTVTSLEDAPYDGGTAAAVADARCHHATNLASIWASVEAEHQWSLLPAHSDALADLFDATTLATTP